MPSIGQVERGRGPRTRFEVELLADRIDRMNRPTRRAELMSLPSWDLAALYSLYVKQSAMWPAGRRIANEIFNALASGRGGSEIEVEEPEGMKKERTDHDLRKRIVRGCTSVVLPLGRRRKGNN